MAETIKIERAWRVGAQCFDTYEEAQKFRTANRKELQRDEFTSFIADLISKCPYGQAEIGSAEDIAERILAAYIVKKIAR